MPTLFGYETATEKAAREKKEALKKLTLNAQQNAKTEKELHEKLNVLSQQEKELLSKIKLVTAAAQDPLLGVNQQRIVFNEHFNRFNLPKASVETKKSALEEMFRHDAEKPPTAKYNLINDHVNKRNTSKAQEKRNADFLAELNKNLANTREEIKKAQEGFKSVQHAYVASRTVQPDVEKLNRAKQERNTFFAKKAQKESINSCEPTLVVAAK